MNITSKNLNSNIEFKRKKEKSIIKLMIKIYCKGNCDKNNQNEMCFSCKNLLNYANEKIDKCPFIESKTFCSKCKIHCYDELNRKQIKKVMKYSGPRMLFYNPVLVFKHLLSK